MSVTHKQDSVKAAQDGRADVAEIKRDLDAAKAENKLLKAQLAATSDRQDFIEDCIAEMAGQVYNV